jgi:hypothetical protein
MAPLRWTMLAFGMAAGGLAGAAPGELERGAAGEPVRILDRLPSDHACRQGAVCLFAASSTVLGDHQEGARARFSRVVHTAANAQMATAPDAAPWTIDLVASLRRPAKAGNALFLIYDAADKSAIAEHQVTALFQTGVKAGNTVAARLTLSGEDGIEAGHSYRIRIAQLIGGKEVVLAETEVTLL